MAVLSTTVDDDWTFRGADTRYCTHCYHDYPARMIPQIADRLLRMYGSGSDKVFDPYCGSGGVLVEGLLHGMETFGTDLNPLARMLARAKTMYIEPTALDQSVKEFLEFSMQRGARSHELPPWLSPERVAFWFQPDVVQQLLAIYSFISHIGDKATEWFFLTAYSETVRECSKTRNGEFKLFRMSEEALSKFRPDAMKIMIEKLGRNRQGYADMLGFIGRKENWRASHVLDFDACRPIPCDAIAPGSIDIVVTSPPYGDSHTTVAYGQFSRLSSEWLGFMEAARVDSMLLGGKRLRHMHTFKIQQLDESLHRVAEQDPARALEVASFYLDLENSITNVASSLRSGGHACYVVANRKVKGTILPTDGVVVAFFERNGFRHVTTHSREIPNKRMPLRNSPTNEPGLTDHTMLHERIVVMQKA